MRFTRGLLPQTGLPAQAGTSVIAALIFAAILGGIALGLHAVQSNSVNPTALPAQALQPVNYAAASPTTQPQLSTTVQSCQAGMDYDYSLSAQGKVQLKLITTCPSEAAIAAIINKENAGKPLPSMYYYPGPDESTNLIACADGKPVDTEGGVCEYTKQTDNSYKLEKWTCQIRFVDPSQTDPSRACWTTKAQVGGSAAPPSWAPGSPGGAGGSVVVSPDTTNPAAVLKNCNGSADSNAYTCTGVTPQQAQSAFSQQGLGNYSCSYADTGGMDIFVNCSPSSTTAGGDGYCTNGSTVTGCNTCPTGEAFDSSGICNPTPAAPPQGAQCPAGQTGTPPNCQTQVVPPPQTQGCPAGMTCTSNNNNNNSGGNPFSGLLSSLSGLTRGLTSGTCYSQPQSQYVGGNSNGTTYVQQQVLNPTTGQVTTVYVPQSTGVTGTGQPCSLGQSGAQQQQQQAPYGTGSNGAACSAPPSQPQCSSGATAQPISASGNGCVTSYQCVPLNGSTLSGTPTPQISCSPQIADVNESVAISYSCQNATGSSGSGFSTSNQLSGSATATITAPPAGTNTATFGLTCTNNGQTANAQCKVQINQPAIDLVANPQAVPSGKTSSIGWVTAGMQSCVISSPDDTTFTAANASNQSASGVAPTDAITGPTEFDLTCQTLGGQTKKASTTVTVGSASSTSPTGSENVTVSSSVDGKSANHGGTVTVTWQSSNAPTGSATSLWLIDVQTEQAVALIAGDQPTSGSYQWVLPAAGATCDPNSIAPCASELVAGNSYGIEASLYTPSNAFLGGSPAPSGAINPSYSDYGYTPTPFTVGQ